jgi:hypothetical protein
VTVHPPTEAELLGQAALRATRPPKMLLDWRLWGAATALVAVLGLSLASVLFWRESRGKDDAASCRAVPAAALRDADSEVIRQTAILKASEAEITAGWSKIVVQLATPRPPGAPPPSYTEGIEQIDAGQRDVDAQRSVLEDAIDSQALARTANLASIKACS